MTLSNACCYFLPVPMAFLSSTRWLNFWDVLYYLAYTQSILEPNPATTQHVTLKLTTHEFSCLLFGLPIDAKLNSTQIETGRKTFGELCDKAHQDGLLLKVEDAGEDWNFNTKGPTSLHFLKLPLYQNYSEIPLISKPLHYLKNGWLHALGSNFYERQLLNLYLLESAAANSHLQDITDLTTLLKKYYQVTVQCLPPNCNYGPKPGPTQLPHLQRRLLEAQRALEARGFIEVASGRLYRPNFETRPETGVFSHLTSSKSGVERQLELYAQKDELRAKHLNQLWATGWLKPNEIKAAWQALPAFNTPVNFETLLITLRKRATVVPEGRSLSWREIEATARTLRSKRGKRLVEVNLLRTEDGIANHVGERKGRLRSVICRKNNISLPLANEQKIPLYPQLASFFTYPQQLNRVKLEVWAKVANWRYFAALDAQLRPKSSTFCLKLFNAEGKLLFEDKLRTIEPIHAVTAWKIPLDQALIKNWWYKEVIPSLTVTGTSKADLSLLYLQFEQVGSEETTSITNWHNLSIRLTFYASNGTRGF